MEPLLSSDVLRFVRTKGKKNHGKLVCGARGLRSSSNSVDLTQVESAECVDINHVI